MMLSIIALLPIIFLIVGMTGLKKPAVLIAPFAFILTVILAFFLWDQPATNVVLAAAEGMVYGLWPIGIIIFGSICLSNLMVKSGSVKQIETIVGSISNDTRIMVVLVAWGLESFLEAIAGFGSGLALPISILTVMGVSPVKAGIVALLANSVPTAYGGVGIGISTLSNISGIAIDPLITNIGIQLFIPSIIMPFVITYVIAGSLQKVKEVFFVPLFAGLGQAIGLLLPLNPALVALVSGGLNIGGGILATQLFYSHLRSDSKIDPKFALKALAPFIFAVAFLVITGPVVPVVNNYLKEFYLSIQIYPEMGAKHLYFRWFTDAGLLLLLSGILGAIVQGLPTNIIFSTIGSTVLQLRKTLLVLVSILAMSRVMTYSGMITSLSQGLASAFGSFYPIIAPVLGTIGVFVTGSVTSSGVLMGALQAEMGNQLGLSPVWLTALNASGSTAGKMLAPHSVAIVMGALGASAEESKITQYLFKALAIYLCVIIMVGIVGVFLNI